MAVLAGGFTHSCVGTPSGGHGLREMPVVVPIPVHPDKRLTRGYNQAELLAASFCEFIGLKLSSNLLLRQTHTQAQHHFPWGKVAVSYSSMNASTLGHLYKLKISGRRGAPPDSLRGVAILGSR
ncbi:hypothetical protein [Gloeomargarita lithophora]|uniref:hypothetical protein n=1 Tax=Gloeomargarita lithophora TaxID=1188228 RepID=UPI0012FDB65F|nr:hypothetical protein [Gloeomargarita lithophora]